MSECRTFRLRVTYKKSGRLAMLSHLELTHAIERIIRRSGLPFALTQGFSPHMKLAFGSALPVGIGSTCEIFDVYLSEYVVAERALSKLKETSPDSLMCVCAEYVETSADAASIAYPFSVYEAEYDEPISHFSFPSQIEVTRKKKQKTLNVRDFLIGDVALYGKLVRFQLKSGKSGSLRPDLFVKASSAAKPRRLTRIAQGADELENSF